MELEDNNCINFLDVLITKNEDGTLGQQVFRKMTHINSYLHVDSHHYPIQKFGILNKSALKVVRICDKDHLDQELDHLSNVFQRNWIQI